MPQPQPQPRTALPPLPAAAPRIARRLPASAATQGGAEPRGAEPGGDHLPGTVQGVPGGGGAEALPSPLTSSPPPCPGPGGHRGGTGSAHRSAPLRTPMGSAPLRSARLRAAFPGAAPPPDPAHRLRPAPRGAAPWGRGGDSPARGCSRMLGATRCCSPCPCFPVLPGAARCCSVLPGDARGCPVLPTLLRPPCPTSTAMPPQLSTALGAAAPSQKSSRPGRAGFLLL